MSVHALHISCMVAVINMRMVSYSQKSLGFVMLVATCPTPSIIGYPPAQHTYMEPQTKIDSESTFLNEMILFYCRIKRKLLSTEYVHHMT